MNNLLIIMPIFYPSKLLSIKLLAQQQRIQTYFLNSSPLHALEARYTGYRLEKILRNHENQHMLSALICFLSERWQWIQGSDSQYVADLNNPANVICIDVAKAIASIVGKPYLLLLMPTLQVIPAERYITSAYTEDELNLYELIISDDQQRLIHVVDVLDFAKDDGELKYNSLFGDQSRLLTDSEHMRLRSRHLAVNQYFLALQDKLNYTLHGENAGAAITRLINGLREGGKLNKGSEFVAAGDSNIAIVEFKLFLDKLSRKTRKLVLDTGITERRLQDIPQRFTIRQDWNSLTTLTKKARDSTRFCVEVIANSLEEVMKENSALHHLTPFGRHGVNNLALLNSNIVYSKDHMIASLSTTDRYPYYYDGYNSNLALQLCSKISKVNSLRLETCEIVYIAELFKTHFSAETFVGHKAYQDSLTILLNVRHHYPKVKIREALVGMSSEVALLVRPHLLRESSLLGTSTNSHRLHRARTKTDINSGLNETEHMRKSARF